MPAGLQDVVHLLEHLRVDQTELEFHAARGFFVFGAVRVEYEVGFAPNQPDTLSHRSWCFWKVWIIERLRFINNRTMIIE